MAGIVRSAVEARGWRDRFTALGDSATTGEEAARSPLAGFLGREKVETWFDTDEGELVVRWVFRDSEDEWYVSGVQLP